MMGGLASSTAGLVLVLAALVGVFILLMGRARRLVQPGATAAAWRKVDTSETISTTPGLIVFKGLLATFAVSELAGNATSEGHNAVFGVLLAVVTLAMAASRTIYLAAGIGLTLLGVVASVPQVIGYLGLTQDCGYVVAPIGRVAILALFALLFALSAFASLMAGPRAGLVEGLLQSGLALYGGISVLLFMSTSSSIGSHAAWSLALGILAACILGAVTPRYPNLVEVVTGIVLGAATLLWVTEPAVESQSAIPKSCLATSVDFSIMAGYIGGGLVMLVGARLLEAVTGRK